MNRISSRLVPFVVAAATFSLAANACGSDTDGDSQSTTPDSAVAAETTVPAETTEPATTDALTIAEPWSRKPAEGQTRTAVYGIVTNTTDAPITIVGASSPITATVELHETLVGDDGTMSMQEVEEGFTVPAGGTFTFEPGGPHIMLLDIDAAAYPTDVDVTIIGDGDEVLTFTAEVRDIAMEEMEPGMENSSTMGGESSMTEEDAGENADPELPA